MSQINRPPIGLQSLLGSQNFGENPSNLLQDVTSQLDLLPFYGAYLQKDVREIGNLIGRGNAVNITVPEGELWLPIVVSGGLIGQIGSTSNIRLAITVEGIPGGFPAPGSGVCVAQQRSAVSSVVGDSCRIVWTPNPPLLLLPGYNLTLDVDKNASAGNENFEFNVWYYDLAL
jgi:hypothetical protein